MRISTLNNIISVWWKIFLAISIILSFLTLMWQYRFYTNKPEIIQTTISSNKNIFNLTDDDKVKFGDRIWNVNYVYSGNDNDYYSITLTDSKPLK